MSESNQPAHLEPSQLGTKSYWDSLYQTEITNHTSNPSDTGTVWFSDSNAEDKIISYLSNPDLSLSPQTTSFIDLGCGNGSLLFSLRSEDWEGHLLGVDYSSHSVKLANQIKSSPEQGLEDDDKLRFQEWDLLKGDYADVCRDEQKDGWDVVLDKGTFDAISLSDEVDAQGRRLVESYKERVLPLVKKETGLFILTSCNWTEDELRSWFVSPDGFSTVGRVQYRTFSFGGQKGQTISTLCFRRN